jgi:hypothetical protein
MGVWWWCPVCADGCGAACALLAADAPHLRTLAALQVGANEAVLARMAALVSTRPRAADAAFALHTRAMTYLDAARQAALLARAPDPAAAAGALGLLPATHRSAYEALVEPQGRPRWHAWALPDVAAALDLVSWHRETPGKLPPIVRLLAKLPPCRCLYRGWVVTLRRLCEGEAGIFEFVRTAVAASLLGLVPRDGAAPFVPPLATAVRVDDWMRRPRAEVVAWMLRVPRVVFHLLRETLVFALRLNAPLREVVDSVYTDWDGFERDVLRTADHIRAHLTQTGTLSDDCAGADAGAGGGARYVHKIHKASFETLLLQALRRAAPADPPDVAQWRHSASRVASRASRSLLLGRLAEALWVVGVDAPAARRLQALHVDYQRGTASLHSFTTKISALPAADRAAAAQLLEAMHIARRLFAMPVAHDLAQQQLAALRARYSLPEGTRALPPQAGVVFYCAACDDLKCFDAQEAPLNVFASGVPRVFVNTEHPHSRLHCNRKFDSDNTGCGGSALIPVDLKGRIVFNRDRCLMLCPRCAVVCRFDLRRCAGPDGFSCGVCVEHDRQRAAPPEPVLQTPLGPPLTCLYCSAPHARGGCLLYTYDDEDPDGDPHLLRSVWICRKHVPRRALGRLTRAFHTVSELRKIMGRELFSRSS